MTLAVLSEAPIMCDMATAPGVLSVTQNQTVICAGVPFATVMDAEPDVNIPPMGLCISMANPETASETAADLGVLTPGPCMPVPTGPWECLNQTVTINGMAMLDQTGMLECSYGGMITITEPLCANVDIP